MRVLTPPDVRGVYLHLHGGGFVLRLVPPAGRPARGSSRSRCRVAVVSVEYRLAPGGSVPGRARRLRGGGLWLVENAAQELGSDRLCIGGESAGANLAVVTLLRLRDRHGFTGFRAACLVKGVYDLTLSRVVDGADPALTADDLEALVAAVRGRPRPRRSRPLAAQRRPARPAAGALRGRRRSTRCSTDSRAARRALARRRATRPSSRSSRAPATSSSRASGSTRSSRPGSTREARLPLGARRARRDVDPGGAAPRAAGAA